jgi:HAD superfamily hydrolase (TIGR01509 family)
MTSKWAVLWDLDGTLVDTGSLHYSSWKAILKSYDRDITYEQFAHTFGMNNTAVLKYWFGDPTVEFIEELSEVKESYFREHIRENVTVLPGVLAWLQRFQSWGWPQAIASSAPMKNVQALVDALELRPYFELLLSAEAMPSKPDPAVFLEGARQLGFPASRSVVFEDAPAGVEGAYRAAMKCVAVLNTHPAESLSQATLIVPTLAALTPDALLLALQDSPAPPNQ